MIPDRQGCKGSGFRSADGGTWQLRNDVFSEGVPKIGQESAVTASIGYFELRPTFAADRGVRPGH